MSWWTSFRDGLETAAALVANYYYPGSGVLAQFINSKGSQEQLNTPLGQIAMLGTGVAGGAAGNMDNYGATMSAMSNGAGAGGSAAEGGATGTSTLGGSGAGSTFNDLGTFNGSEAAASGADPQAVRVAQTMISKGASPGEAIQMAGLTPAQAEQAGLQSGAGQTWSDVARNTGTSYTGNSDAIPTQFSGAGPTAGTGATAASTTATNAFPTSTGTLSGAPVSSTGYGTGMPDAAASGTGSAPWGSMSNLSTMASGLYGLAQAQQTRNLGAQAGRDADPFGQYRGQYANQMSALAADPSLLEKQPGYLAGQQAIQRTMAAQGYTGSGNMMAAMAKYGGDFYNQTMNNYAGWAGAGFNPAAGAQLHLQGNAQANALAGQSLASLGYGVRQAGG